MKIRTAAFLLAGLAALAAALSTGSSIYYYLSLTLIIMLFYALVSAIWVLFTVRATVECPQKTVVRGRDIKLSVSVRHFCPLPVRSLEVRLSVPDDHDAVSMVDGTAPPFAVKKFEASFSCPHRGGYEVGVTGAQVTDLFNLVTISKKIGGNLARLEVQPRVGAEEPIALESVETGAEHISRMTDDTASPSGVRDWVPGDALKKVHWKLTMRRRELVVRTYEESARPDTLILADLSPINLLRGQALYAEDTICEAALAIAVAQMKAGYPVRMPLNCRQPTEISGQDPVETARFVEALMRVKFDSPYSFEQVMTMETRRMARTGGIVLVTTLLNARLADAATQLRRSGMQVAIFWVTDTQRAEALEMLTRLKLAGVRARQLDPWAENLAI